MQDLRSLLTPREVPTGRAIKVYLTLLSLLQGPDPRQTGQKTAFTYVSVHTCMTLVFNLLISLLLFASVKVVFKWKFTLSQNFAAVCLGRQLDTATPQDLDAELVPSRPHEER